MMATQLFLFSNISRPFKGKSIVASPSAYVRLYIKTTGLDPMWDSIIELTAAHYKDGVEVDRFIRPDIPNDAPAAKKVFKDFADYLKSDDILIGCNSDINFLYDSFVEYKVAPLSNDFIDLSSQKLRREQFFGRYCAFTGRLERYKRSEAMQIVADWGGFTEKNVTKRTDFLILGNNEYGKRYETGYRKTNKHQKAERLILAGQHIEMIPENVFYDTVDN